MDVLGLDRSRLLLALLGEEAGNVQVPANPHYPVTVSEAMRLDEAVGFALAYNYELAAAHEKAAISKWELVGGYGAYLPKIDYTREGGMEVSRPAAYNDVNGDTVAYSRHRTTDRTYTIRQPLVDPTTIADILLRHKTLDAASAEELGAREKTALDTITSYFRLVQGRLVLSFAERYKGHLDRLASRMRDRVAGGGAAQVDLDRINARSVTARSAIIEGRAEIDAALVEFRRLTGQVPQALQLPGQLLPAVPVEASEVLARAMEANPEYLLANLHVDMAETDTWKAATRFLPKLSVEVSDTKSWNRGGASLGDPNAGPVYADQSERRVMGVVRWSLNGGVDAAQTMASMARARQANYQALDARMRIEESVRVAFDALTAARGRIDALKQAQEANQRVAATFEEQYLAGSRQLLDLLDAYERLYQSQVELTRLVIAETNAGYLLRRQMGELVPAVLSADHP